MDSHFHGNDIRSNEITTGSTQVTLSAPLAMTEGLKLTIFTYKWGKCVKHVGKGLPESLTIFPYKNW